MRPKGSPEQLEVRRRRAATLLAEGKSPAEVARLVGCDPSSVSRWRAAVKSGGDAALRARAAGGRPPRLTAGQKEELVRCLLEGPMAHGYRTALWTTKRVAQLVERRFGVQYHPDHVGRLLHWLGWSHQKPERRALQRDEKTIEEWKRKEWPRIKRGRRGWAPTSSS
jgi:transposase